MIIYTFYNELSKKSPIFLEETITEEKKSKKSRRYGKISEYQL